MDNNKPEFRRGFAQRLEFRLFREGYVNRGDLMERFGLSVNQASTDLNRYLAQLRSVAGAIRRSEGIEVKYRSLSNPEPRWRWIVSHAIAFDRFRDDNALVARFDLGITKDLVEGLAGHAPLRVVFRNNGFVSATVKIKIERIFRQLTLTTEVRSI